MLRARARNSAAGRRGHRGARHHQRHLAAGGPQLLEAAEGRPGGGIADDQVILAVPAAQRVVQRPEALRIIVDRHQHRNRHRLALTSTPPGLWDDRLER